MSNDNGNEFHFGDVTPAESEKYMLMYSRLQRVRDYLEHRMIELECEKDELQNSRENQDFSKIGIRDSPKGEYYTEYGKMIAKNNNEMTGVLTRLAEIKEDILKISPKLIYTIKSSNTHEDKGKSMFPEIPKKFDLLAPLKGDALIEFHLTEW